MLPEALFGEVSVLAAATILGVALVAGCARGLAGFGAGLIFIPLVGAVIGPQRAAALLLLIDIVGGLPTVPSAWREADRGPVLVMFAGALIGLPAGLALLIHLEAVTVRWGISLIVLCLLVLLISGWRWRGSVGAGALVTVGGFSGVLSGLAQIGGPPVVAFWLGGTRPVPILRANIMLYFALSSVASLVAYGASGLIDRKVLALAALVLPVYTAGVMLGIRAFHLADPALFRRVALSLIAFAAVLGMPLWG